MTKYDTLWWMAHAEKYRRSFVRTPGHDAQEAAIAAVAKELRLRTIFEAGCGAGRISKLLYALLSPETYTATDLVPDPRLDGPLRPQCWSFAQPPYPPSDLVVAVELLMHRAPEFVAADVRALCAMAKRWVLTCDWYGETPAKPHEGCYQHDYPALFEANGFDVTEHPIPLARQSAFLATRKAA